MHLYAFTDGSSIKDSSIGGIGVYIPSLNTQVSERYTVYNDQPPTNQRMELLAIKRAIEICIDKMDNVEWSLTVISDSLYAINCITVWSKEWGEVWHKKCNTDLIKPLCEYVKKYKITFKHVRSHQKEPVDDTDRFLWNGNREADILATSATSLTV